MVHSFIIEFDVKLEDFKTITADLNNGPQVFIFKIRFKGNKTKSYFSVFKKPQYKSIALVSKVILLVDTNSI